MIDRCICNDVRFEEALEVSENYGCQSVSELRDHLKICDTCQMCLPYLQEMLETGKVEFNP